MQLIPRIKWYAKNVKQKTRKMYRIQKYTTDHHSNECLGLLLICTCRKQSHRMQIFEIALPSALGTINIQQKLLQRIILSSDACLSAFAIERSLDNFFILYLEFLISFSNWAISLLFASLNCSNVSLVR